MKKLWQFKLDFIRKNPILSSYISFMKGVIITIILCSLLSSCKIYTYPPQPEITSVLAVTSKGDTIQVSTDVLREKFIQNPGNYSNWQFNWANNWYYGYGWFNNYDPYWVYRNYPRYYYFGNPRVKNPIRRNYSPPRYVPNPNTPRRVDVPNKYPSRPPQVQPNRGRSNQQPRQPQYVQPRTRTTPNVIQRPTRGTNSPIRNKGNQ